MPRRIRHHVNPLKLGFVAGLAPSLSLHDGRPLEVELGCADAAFLFERAAEDQGPLYVGVEIREEMVRRVNERAGREGAAPVCAVFGNINADLPRLFPAGRVARFYLNFPDPWFKKRHHKRRVLNADLAATLAATLAPRGEVFFQTDVFDLALDAMEVLERERSLENVLRPWSFERDSPFAAQSRRERQSLRRGRRVWRLRYRRRDPEGRAGGHGP
jgi:tRNA (guanine-N7-)-methyltransferase